MFIFASFLSSILVCGLLIHLRRWHIHFSGDHDLNGPQKFHHDSTTRIGGMAIFIGMQIGLGGLVLARSPLGSGYFFIIVASVPVFVAGFVEDITKNVGIKWRLLSAFISGILFVLLFEIDTIHLDVFYLDAFLQNPFLSLLFLSFAIAGMSNAYNIIDGFNGLASMVGIISLCAIAYIGFEVDDSLVTNTALLAIAAIAGFFLWNYPCGLIFLGDSGAYLIGFLVACLSILLVAHHTTVSPWFALMVNAYPIFETLFTMWRRHVHQDKSVGLPDGTHFHSLIYRRVIRRAQLGDGKQRQYLRNAKTSPYLWVLSSIGAIPAVLWWDSSAALMVTSAVFAMLYVYLYRKIVRFQTPWWINRLPK